MAEGLIPLSSDIYCIHVSLWRLHVLQWLKVSKKIIIANQFDFMFKFILQVLKWYMFPGIVLTMRPTPLWVPSPSNIPKSKWKDIVELTYLRAQNVQYVNIPYMTRPKLKTWCHWLRIFTMVVIKDAPPLKLHSEILNENLQRCCFL